MDVKQYIVGCAANIRRALIQIEKNHLGVVFVADEKNEIRGVATDGDVRRFLLAGGTLDEPIVSAMNKEFTWVEDGITLELLLKKFDEKVQVLPVLNNERQLVNVVTRDNQKIPAEEPVFARARAPVRISFGGGGSDLTHYFSGENIGAVINSTISLFCHATLKKRSDSRVLIESLDLRDTLKAPNLDAALREKGSFKLIQSVLQAIRPNFGFELCIDSDFPIGSGLGGSATVCAAILGCFNQFRTDKWTPHELAEIAYKAERHLLGIAGGWQDQYATVFGGFNFIEFHELQNVVHPLRIGGDILSELEESLILCNTGITHDSGALHIDQKKQMSKMKTNMLMSENVRICYHLRDNLIRGNLAKVGSLLDESWRLKKQFSRQISTTDLDQIYDGAIEQGALGGKLLGAGGGGFFLFYVPPFQKHSLIQYLENLGLMVQPFQFDALGLKSWSVRENNYPTWDDSR